MSDRLTESELTNLSKIQSEWCVEGFLVPIPTKQLETLIATARRESSQAASLTAVTAEREAMAKVVEWYADPKNYVSKPYGTVLCESVVVDGGKIAVDALAALNSPPAPAVDRRDGHNADYWQGSCGECRQELTRREAIIRTLLAEVDDHRSRHWSPCIAATDVLDMSEYRKEKA